MNGPKRPFRYRYRTHRLLGVLLLGIGSVVVAVLVLPYAIWMALLGMLLIIIGYKLYK